MSNKKHLLITGLLLCAGHMAYAQSTYKSFPEATINSVSPNGSYVVGNNLGYDNVTNFSSFVYSTADGKTNWRTEYDEDNYDNTGKFQAVNSNGAIAGAMKDKDHLLAIENGDYIMGQNGKRPNKSGYDADVTYVPIVTAAVWKDDKTYKLGMGNHTIDELGDETDGTYATAISEDGNTVTGYLQSWWMKIIPCLWTYNADSDSYTYQELTLPKGFSRASATGISADGSIIIGEGTKNGYTYPIVWTSATQPTAISLGDSPYSDATAVAISPNGSYVLMHGNGYGVVSKLAIYDTTTGNFAEIALPDADNTYQCKGLAITDSGDVFCTISDNVDYTDKLYYYNKASETLADIDYYLSKAATDISNLPSLVRDKVVSVSADGKVIAGNSSYSGGWVITLASTEAVIITAPQPTAFFYSGYDQVTLRWEACQNVPEGAVINNYKVYIDDQLAATIDAAAATDGKFSYTHTVRTGTHNAYIMATATYNGNEIESATSETISTYLSAKNDLPLYDNFDEATLDPNGNPVPGNDYWRAERLLGDDACLIKWSIDANNYENATPYLCTTSINTTPWSSVVTSPFLTSEDADKLYVSFYTGYTLVNTPDQDLDSDYLDVEYALDGENWMTVKSICADDLDPYSWNFFKVDLDKSLTGKPFQIRFNAHGEGRGTLRWNLDCIGISDVLEGKTPSALKAMENADKSVQLMWHNSIGTYEASYLQSRNVITDFCVGSEGEPLITAIDLEPAQLANHVGEYISGVSTFIYDNPYIETNMATQAEAIVYVDGKEVTRQTFANSFNEPVSSCVKLSAPVKIESGKTYRVAVRIFNYDALQTPAYYQSSEHFVPGKSDLYSEDEGKTWNKLSDVYTTEEERQQGQCIWPIRALITDGTIDDEPAYDDQLMAYNVYRNGEQLNHTPVFVAHPYFIDQAPVSGATYTVQAFYKDGRVSECTAAVDVTPSAINSLFKGNDITISQNGNALTISGAYDHAELLGTNGTRIAQGHGSMHISNLPAGIYLLRVNANGNSQVQKVIIK